MQCGSQELYLLSAANVWVSMGPEPPAIGSKTTYAACTGFVARGKCLFTAFQPPPDFLQVMPHDIYTRASWVVPGPLSHPDTVYSVWFCAFVMCFPDTRSWRAVPATPRPMAWHAQRKAVVMGQFCGVFVQVPGFPVLGLVSEPPSDARYLGVFPRPPPMFWLELFHLS